MAELKIKSEKESDGGLISYLDAKKMIDAYEATIANDGDKNVRYFRIKAKYLRDLTMSSDCEYVSFYIGLELPKDEEKKVPVGHTLILVGVNAQEENILEKADVINNKIYQHLRSCPTNCGKNGAGNNLPEEF